MNANFCIFDFYFLMETDPEAPRSETLVAGLRSASYPTAGDNAFIPVMTRTLNPAVLTMLIKPHRLAPKRESDKRKERRHPEMLPMVRQARELWLNRYR